MNRMGTPAVSFMLLAWPWALALAESTDESAELRVPPGFVVEQVAGPPLVTHPMMASFDDQGRLYVADAAGVNLEAEELLRELPNRMLRLEDTDGDGRFDRSTVFADRMTFPMGSLWYRGAVYVASPPSIWKLVDTDDDGVADQRDELVSKFGFIGNAADIHGCFLGPDGRIYWCDGRHGHEFVDSQGRSLSKGKAARIFSCHRDGSQVEVFCGGGMDNPVELAFSPEGELFGTMTFYNPDDVRHDALVHYLYGGVYPRKHEVVREFARTGDFLPPLRLYDTVAPAGLCRYQGEAWGEEFRDNLFSVHFNTHRVLRHRLQRVGASYRADDEDWLVSPNIDFHPTDVMQDADGSLLVINTGGWFRHGCPTSQVAKPEILGAIYRIRKADAQPLDDPRGLRLAWQNAPLPALAERLGDRRPAVRERAIDTLALRGDEAVGTLAALVGPREFEVERALGAVWALTRIDTPSARQALRAALDSPHASARLAAVRALGTLRDVDALERLIALVEDPDPALRREAATALGRLGRGEAVAPLLAALATDPERMIEHPLIYALVELGQPELTRAGLTAEHPLVRRGALIALDQMSGGNLTADQVVSLVDSGEPALRLAALGVLEKHPQWAPELRTAIERWMSAEVLTPADQERLRGALVALAVDAELQQRIAARLIDSGSSSGLRTVLCEAIVQSQLEPTPALWHEAVARALGASEPALAETVLWTIDSLGPETFVDSLERFCQRPGLDPTIRSRAWTLLGRGGGRLPTEAFSALVQRAAAGDSDEFSAFDRRLTACDALGRARLSTTQRLELAPVLTGAGPLELPRLLSAIGGIDPADATVQRGETLLAAALSAPGLAAIEPGDWNLAWAVYPEAIRQKAAAAWQQRRAPPAADREKLDSLLTRLSPGSPERGRQVFFGHQAACSGCHRIGDSGGQVGPDLSTIGRIRVRRDLVESILLPSASLARGYESVVVSTSGGLTHTGVLSRESPAAIHLRTARRDELRIPRSQIEQLVPSATSVMPTGLDAVLGPEQLSDLVSYLESLR